MDRPSLNAGGAHAALRRLAPVALFFVLPGCVITTMFVVGLTVGPIVLDFDTELYPQAKDALAGRNPYPHEIWPPFAMLVAMPFTILPSTAANVAFGFFGLVCMAIALRLVEVRDWRVYGIAFLW